MKDEESSPTRKVVPWGRVDWLLILGFAAVALLVAARAQSDYGLGPDQAAYGALAQEFLEDWRAGRQLEGEYGTPYRQTYALALAAAQRLTGGTEASLRLILILSTLAYLLAMYVLLRQITGHRGLSALVAIVSVAQRYTLGTSFWGMGEYQAILPRIVVLPVVPLAWAIFLRTYGSRKVLFSFLVVAVGISLHLSAVYFYAVGLTTLGLFVLFERQWSRVVELAVLTVLLLVAMNALPNPSASTHLIKNLGPGLLAGGVCLGLVLLTLRVRRVLFDVGVLIALLLYLGWIVGGFSLFSLFGTAAAPERFDRQKPAVVEAAKPATTPAARPAKSADPSPERRLEPAAVADRSVREAPVRDEPAETVAAPAGEKVARRALETERQGPGSGEERPPPGMERAESEAEPGVRPAPLGAVPELTSAREAEQARDPVANEGQAESRDTVRELNEALYARFGWTLFPISLATIAFCLFSAGLLVLLAPYEALRRWREEGGSGFDRVHGYFVFGVFFVSLGLTAAIQVYCHLTHRPYIVLELFRAFRFIYLPLYVYLALALHRWWIRPGNRSVRDRLLLAGLLTFLLVSPKERLRLLPDALKLGIRSVAERSGSLNGADPSQNYYLQLLLPTRSELRRERERHAAFQEVAQWARDNTPRDSLFLTTDYQFVHGAQRDIMVSYQQGAGSARSVAERLGHRAWHEAYKAVSDAFASGDPQAIVHAARTYDTDYIVVSASVPLPLPLIFGNERYAIHQVVAERITTDSTRDG